MLLILQPTRQKHIVDAIGNALKSGVGKYQFFVDERFQDALRIGGGADIVFLDELGGKKIANCLLFALEYAKTCNKIRLFLCAVFCIVLWMNYLAFFHDEKPLSFLYYAK